MRLPRAVQGFLDFWKVKPPQVNYPDNPLVHLDDLQLTHQQKVTRLYRKALKHSLSWTIDRQVWRQEALELRERFDANKDLPAGGRQAKEILWAGECEFHEMKHPLPYIHPQMPGGTKYERNPPPPSNALELMPHEEQWLDEMDAWADACPHYQKYLADCKAKGVTPAIDSSHDDGTILGGKWGA